MAAGRGRVTLGLQASWLTALVVALPLAARLGGIRGVAIGHAVVAVGLVIPLYLVALRRTGVRPAALGRAVRRPAFGGMLLVVAAVSVASLLRPPAVALVVGTATGLVAYLLTVAPMRSRLGAALRSGAR